MSKLNIYQKIRRISSLSIALLTLGGCSSYKPSINENTTDVKMNYSKISKSEEKHFNKPYCWPIENVISDDNIQIVSNYGYNNVIYDDTSKIIMGNYHRGVDIVSNDHSDNVIAANDGIVIYASLENMHNNNSGYGNYVVIQHNDSNYTLYGHLQDDSITVTKGDAVCQGQIIGKIGQTGNAFAPHLHFELREGANSCYSTVDPLDYINNSKIKAK